MPTGRKHAGGRRRGSGKGKKKRRSCQSHELVKTMSWCTHFPFLRSKRAMALIRRSRVMFLMRGLPGSGKSTIVKHLVERFPSAVVCSADSFMRNEDGSYHFDRSKVSIAHNNCRIQAAEACYRGLPVIVDNTNLKRYEFSFYLLVAQVLSYHVIFVEPRTPWARDPEELSRRTVHGVSVQELTGKLIGMRPIVAFYYGWFLDLRDTDYVCRAARRSFALLTAHRSFANWYGEVVDACPPEFEEIDDVADDGAQSGVDKENGADKESRADKESGAEKQNGADKEGGVKNAIDSNSDSQLTAGPRAAEADIGNSAKACETEMRKNLKRTHSHQVDSAGVYKSRANRLHVTTMYARRDSHDEVVEYGTSRHVMNSLGSVGELCITAFFFTPRTIGARVQLTAEQRSLWAKPNEFVEECSDELPVDMHTFKNAPSAMVLSDEEVEELSDDSGSELSEEDDETDLFCPSSSDVRGDTAHITIGFVKGQKAAETGIDLYKVICLERKVKLSCADSSGKARQALLEHLLLEEFRIDLGTVRHYAGGFWVVYLDKPVRTDGLFTGCYYH